MIADVDLALLFGLANSAHCAGMCGPFALAAAGGARRRAAFLSGKAFAYVFLGALAGALGGSLSGAWQSAAHLLAWITGGALLLAGLLALQRALADRPPLHFGVRLAARLPAVGGPFGLGVLTGFLPCGVLALAVLRALAQPGAASGALFMLAFAAGTAPSLLLVMISGRGLLARLGPRRAALAGAGLLLLAGTLALLRAASDGAHGDCLACSS